MIEYIAILGVFLFWLNLFCLPVLIGRVFSGEKLVRTRALAALAAFVVVLLGYTHAMSLGGSFLDWVWSFGWFVPLVLTIRGPGKTQVERDRSLLWLLIGGVLSFLPAHILLVPTAMLLFISVSLWS